LKPKHEQRIGKAQALLQLRRSQLLLLLWRLLLWGLCGLLALAAAKESAAYALGWSLLLLLLLLLQGPLLGLLLLLQRLFQFLC
jgi:hypothetical protein